MKATLPIYVLQSLQGHISVVQNFIFSLNTSSEFMFPVSLEINSHILGANEDMHSVPKYTVWFFRPLSFGLFLKLYGFYIKWKMSFIISGPKSFFVLKISVAKFCRFFGECSLIYPFLISHQKREISLKALS